VSHAGTATWIVATSSTQGGADIELATGDPVLAMGGFTGSDPAMTVERLQALVSEGKLRYVLVGSGGAGGGPGGGTGGPGGGTSDVLSWVEANGTVVDYGGSSGTLYDLSTALATTSATTTSPATTSVVD
ncbi:MAG: hypothetical protein ACHQ3P_09145, partial [Candidatus Limnocylindrales bacterium]